jgi:hypothetical protein
MSSSSDEPARSPVPKTFIDHLSPVRLREGQPIMTTEGGT